MTFLEFFEGVIELLVKFRSAFITGVFTTIELACITVFFGLVFGTLVAFMKMSNFSIFGIKPLNIISTIYIEIIRGTPLLLQLYFFYFVFESMDKKTSIIIALIVNSAAYVSEIVRSGILAVDPGQTEAARCLGLSQSQTMRKIIIPQAVKNILPALGNELIMMLKETSLASTFYLGEIMTQCNVVGGATFMQIQTLTISGILYFILTFTLSRFVNIQERKLKVSD